MTLRDSIRDNAPFLKIIAAIRLFLLVDTVRSLTILLGTRLVSPRGRRCSIRVPFDPPLQAPSSKPCVPQIGLVRHRVVNVAARATPAGRIHCRRGGLPKFADVQRGVFGRNVLVASAKTTATDFMLPLIAVPLWKRLRILVSSDWTPFQFRLWRGSAALIFCLTRRASMIRTHHNLRLTQKMIQRLLIVFCVFVSPMSSGGSEPLTDRDSVATALDASLTSLHSIECEYHVVFPLTKGNNGAEPRIDRFLWAESGNQKLLTLNLSATEPAHRFWMSFDGDTGYSCDFGADPPFAMVKVSRTPIVPQLSLMLAHIPQLLGRRSSSGEWSLPQAIRDSGHFHGVSTIHGASCVVIDSITVPDTPDRGMALTIWCDVEHGYLPRRLLTAKRGLEPDVALQDKTGGWYLREITELLSVEDKLLGETRWLPKTVELIGARSSQSLIVDRAQVNHPIETDRFRPTLVAGVEVLSQDADGRISSTVFGGPTAVAERQQQLVKEAEELAKKQLQKNSHPIAIATPPKSSWLRWLLAVIGLYLLILGVGLARRGR